MKVLQINSVVNTVGTGRIVEDIGNLAIQNGWESYIAYGRNANNSKSKLIKIGSPIDYFIHGLLTRIFDRQGLGSKRATKKFIKQIETIKPDVIHLHNLHGYYLNVVVLFEYLAIADIPIVWTFHDCWPITGHCAYFDYINCTKWISGCFDCPQKTKYPASFSYDRSKKNQQFKKELFTSINSVTIVSVSKWLNSIINHSFLNQFPRQIINNGIDTTLFTHTDDQNLRNKYNIQDKFIILGVANKWELRKGLSDFKKLSNLLDNNCVIILVGLSSIQTKNLRSNIICIPRIDHIHDLANLYSVADVFVNTSVEESFGLTTVEALSCGTPVIVYNATACPETVSSETGFVVEKNNIKGLWDSINTIRENGKEHYSSHCSEHAHNFYKNNDRYLDYINLYCKMKNLK